jgi:hypothetical protein
MLPRGDTDQRVDTPAPVDPGGEAGGFEELQYVQDVVLVHSCCASLTHHGTYTGQARPLRVKTCLGAYTDTERQWLDGARDYTVHVPADPPAKLFWSFTVYDARTRCLIDNEQQHGDRGSRDADLVHNPDGSVDLYFGPKAPESGTANWVQTIPGRHWFSYFRLYGPLEPYFDKTWRLGDITPA